MVESLAKKKSDEEKANHKIMRELRKNLKHRKRVVNSIVNSNFLNLKRYHSQLKYYERLEDYQDSINRQVSANRAQSILHTMQGLHRGQADKGEPGQWLPVPYAHGPMVFTQAGASAVAQIIRQHLLERSQ